MTHAIENFNHIADAVNSVLRRGIVLIDREDKIRAATLLVADRLPEFSRAELKSALRQISVINQDPNLRPIQPTNGGTPPPGGGFPHEQEFRRFLKETRIMGEPAINSYVSFINGASNDLGESVPRILLAWTGAPEEIVTRLAKLMTENDCHPKTINNRKTAMRAYLEMTAKYGLRARPLGKSENGGEQKPGRISKSEARRHAQQCGITVTSDMRFANINSTVQTVWWLYIPTKIIRREGDVTILLYDNRNGKLHYLQVPTSHFKENRDRWKTRKSDGRIKLELSTQEGDLFRDRCSEGKISFAQFHRGEC